MSIFVNVPSKNIENQIKINKWKVREGYQVANNQVILLYELVDSADKEIKRLKSDKNGTVKRRLCREGDTVKHGDPLLELSACIHTTVIKDMCADCGADLRQEENANPEASVPMIHSVPELKVTESLAQELGRADTARLLEDRKLVLLVDLDQTLIHTTNDNVPNNLKGVYHFQLYGPSSPWYHTRLRPGTPQFLKNIAPYYELHICTFGARNYAHTIAQFLDEDGKYFSHRILSRDECLSATSKKDNLKALFPCGDSMVCIIDDREDVWNMASNLIQVKPYHFFQHTGDINAPPGMDKHELDGEGVDLTVIKKKENGNGNKNNGDANEDNNDPNVDTDAINSPSSEESIKTDDTNAKPIISDENSVNVKDDKETIDGSDIIKDERVEKDIVKKEPTPDSDDNLIEVEDPDDYLLYLEQVLINIHKTYYEHFDESKEVPDLKLLIPEMRSQVLKNKHLVFSGLVPKHMKLEQMKAYLVAKSLGANITQNISRETTHLVAVVAGTQKYNLARERRNIKIVSPDWLWSCAERWECVDEAVFPLDPKKPSTMREPPPHCHSPEHSVSYNERPSTSSKSSKPTPKFMDTINPLLSFSNADLAEMNQEFDQFFDSSGSSDDDDDDNDDDRDGNGDDDDYDLRLGNQSFEKKTGKRKRVEESDDETDRKVTENGDEIGSFMSGEIVNSEIQIEEERQSTDSNDDEGPADKFRRGEDLPSDLDMGDCGSEGSDDPVDEDDDGEWNMLGAALEREFLGLE